MNSKLIKDLNVKLEIIKLLKKICSLILRHQSSQFFFFFDQSFQARETEEK